MDTMSTETAPVEEATPDTKAAETGDTTEETQDTSEGQETSVPDGGDTVESLRARLAATEDEADRAKRFIVNFVSGRANADQATAPPDPIGNLPADNVIEEFKENPIGLLDKHFATRMAPIVADNLEARAKDNRNNAIQRLGAETWQEYGDEIDRFMGGLSLHTRANPGSYEEALHFVRAKNIDKEIDKRVNAKLKALEDEKKGLVEGSGTRVGGMTGGNGAPRMTEVEKQIAKGFGMSEKDWMKYKTPRERRNG
jgi:hypothetical protein